jgi:ribonuclease P protein component
MLSREHRIPSSLFPGVLRGKTTQNDLFRLVVKTEGSLRVPKYAVIVPTKLAKTAVARNRVRRVVYAALASYTAKNQPAFYIIFPKKVVESASEAEQGLKKLL